MSTVGVVGAGCIESGSVPNAPRKIQNDIMCQVEEFPRGIEEAKELMLDLMEERKLFVQKHNDQFTSEAFSLCEH